VAEDFGGPVWHASGLGRNERESRRIALDGIGFAGEVTLGQWISAGVRQGIIHVQRRLSVEERDEFGVPEPYDIRGTAEEHRRIAAVYAEAPHLRGRLA
jgi:hypothetical protein